MERQRARMSCDANNCENIQQIRCRAYIYPGVKYCPGDVSARARYM